MSNTTKFTMERVMEVIEEMTKEIMQESEAIDKDYNPVTFAMLNAKAKTLKDFMEKVKE